MPKNIRKLLIIEKRRCRIRQHPNKKGYEIRFRRDGYDISASGITIEIAKANFLSKLKSAKQKDAPNVITPKTFNAFAQFYFEKFRKEQVAPKTFYNDMSRYNKYIQPYFKERAISKITPAECKSLIDSINAAGKGKTADEVYSLLNCIFKSAIAHAIIANNPLNIVLHITHERESGTALTREEENTLYAALMNDVSTPIRYRKTIALALFCGLRTNEYYKMEIKPPFIIAENSKRKNKKVEYKRIPIIAPLKPFVDDGAWPVPTEKYLRDFLKKVLPNHTLKDLRKTFNTRCKEYDVSDHARKQFMGHSLGALDSTYTGLSDEFLIKEAKKLDKWFAEFPKSSPKI